MWLRRSRRHASAYGPIPAGTFSSGAAPEENSVPMASVVATYLSEIEDQSFPYSGLKTAEPKSIRSEKNIGCFSCP